MSTLVHVSSKRPREDLVSRSQVAQSIDLTFDWYQRYWKYLQRSKCIKISTCLRVEHASIRTSWQGSTVEEAKFPEVQFFCGYTLHKILVQFCATPPYPDARMENGIT